MIGYEMIINNLRHMAWERAKGELRSMMHTFWSNRDNEQYDALNETINNFIDHVENEGLQE